MNDRLKCKVCGIAGGIAGAAAANKKVQMQQRAHITKKILR